MFKILEKNTLYSDRFRLNISTDGYKSNDDHHGIFILSKDSVLETSGGKIHGCFGAYTNNHAIVTGSAIIIEFMGINFPRTVMAEIKSGEPGDLSYIDGCSNSVIVAPPRNGEPCINYLYFPPNITQTHHVHPSVRIGLVLSGEGKATVAGKDYLLTEGTAFILDRFDRHGFSTENSHMSLAVFHPDSESGPTDEFNPMKSRTYIQ